MGRTPKEKTLAFDFQGAMPSQGQYRLSAVIEGAGLSTNVVTLPDPAGRAGYRVGPTGLAQALGVFIPDTDRNLRVGPVDKQRLGIRFQIQVESGPLSAAALERIASERISVAIVDTNALARKPMQFRHPPGYGPDYESPEKPKTFVPWKRR